MTNPNEIWQVEVGNQIFTFYCSIVFSVVLGYALYKSSDRVNFRQS